MAVCDVFMLPRGRYQFKERHIERFLHNGCKQWAIYAFFGMISSSTKLIYSGNPTILLTEL